MKNEMKSLLIYTFTGIVAGAISYYLKNSLLSLGLAIVLLYITYLILQKMLKINEKFKWFLSNGGWIYIFVWYIVWAILYNVII